MLRTNLATRRTFVRLRANPDKPEALSGLGLSVLHLFFLSPKRGCKKTCRFFTAPSNLIIGFIYKSHQKPFTVNTITSVADLSSRSSVIIVMMLPSESNAELQNHG